jgi:hypothetical protein
MIDMKLKRMTENEYREKLDALGLTQIDAAQFLDVAERTSRRCALLASIAIKVQAYAAWTAQRASRALHLRILRCGRPD